MLPTTTRFPVHPLTFPNSSDLPQPTLPSSSSDLSRSNGSIVDRSGSASSLSELKPPPPPPPTLPNYSPRSPNATDGSDKNSGSECKEICPSKPREITVKGGKSFVVYQLARAFEKPTQPSSALQDKLTHLTLQIQRYKNKALDPAMLYAEMKKANKDVNLDVIIPDIVAQFMQLDDRESLYKFFITEGVKEEREKDPPFRESNPGTLIFFHLLRQEFSTLFSKYGGYHFSQLAAKTIIALAPKVVFGTEVITKSKDEFAKQATVDFINRIAYQLYEVKGSVTSETKRLCRHFLNACETVEFKLTKRSVGNLIFDKVCLVSVLALRCVNPELVRMSGFLGSAEDAHYKKFSPLFKLLYNNFLQTINVVFDLRKANVDAEQKYEKIITHFSSIVESILSEQTLKKSAKETSKTGQKDPPNDTGLEKSILGKLKLK